MRKHRENIRRDSSGKTIDEKRQKLIDRALNAKKLNQKKPKICPGYNLPIRDDDTQPIEYEEGDIRIIGIHWNPNGQSTTLPGGFSDESWEWVLIENTSNKLIDMYGWSFKSQRYESESEYTRFRWSCDWETLRFNTCNEGSEDPYMEYGPQPCNDEHWWWTLNGHTCMRPGDRWIMAARQDIWDRYEFLGPLSDDIKRCSNLFRWDILSNESNWTIDNNGEYLRLYDS
tara:strand:+ start:1710 stop:2396 length:687 start_codon:yes stop_codon:yes gene_type:complete